MSFDMRWALVGLVMLGVGCQGGSSGNAGESSAAASAAAQPAAPAQPTLGEAVKPSGTVIEVKLIADAKGVRFDPNAITAHRGDVLKFTLASGVHNVHFPPEKNPGAQGLPPASDQLQLPGQSYDLLVGAKPGTYNFQCDPHAPLGMVGTLKVE